MEKELATPQHYPLTLNALLAACNQTSNRDPVVTLDEGAVLAALDSLKERRLARVVHSPSNRALKYRQVLHEVFALEPQELAVLAVLLLRGPQTVGELRSRTERMSSFSSLDEVDDVVRRLGEKVEPLAVRLDRQPGQKEGRVAHLLGQGDPVDLPADSTAPTAGSRPDPSGSLGARVAGLEAEVARLRDEIEHLRAALDRSPSVPVPAPESP